MERTLSHHLIVLGALCAGLALVSLFAYFVHTPRITENVEQVPIEIPPAMPEDLIAVQDERPFQHLVSYTDRGFEPAYLVIKKNDTVRFSNNSSGELWVSATAASSESIYPGTGNECGQSTLDSCALIEHGRYWQFTFDRAGTWGIQNNSLVDMKGSVQVREEV